MPDMEAKASKGSGMGTGLLWGFVILTFIIAVVGIILIFTLKPKPAPVASLPVTTIGVATAVSGTVTIVKPKTNVYRFNGTIPATMNINVAISEAPASGESTLFFILNDAAGSVGHATGLTPPSSGYLRLLDSASGKYVYLARGEMASCLSSGSTIYAVASNTGATYAS